MTNTLKKLDNIDKNTVLIAMYEVYDLPQSTLPGILKISKDKINEIRQTEEYKTQVMQITTLGDMQQNMEEMVADPERMQVLVTTERMKLYKDIQMLIHNALDILNDDLYQTKKHLVLQTIGILTNSLRALLSDMSKTATDLQMMKGDAFGNNGPGKSLSSADILNMITTKVGNDNEN